MIQTYPISWSKFAEYSLFIETLLKSKFGATTLPWPFLTRFRAFAGERMEEMALILHANVSWPSSEMIRLWSRSVFFFGVTFT